MVSAAASSNFYERLGPHDPPAPLGALLGDVLARYGLNAELEGETPAVQLSPSWFSAAGLGSAEHSAAPHVEMPAASRTI